MAILLLPIRNLIASFFQTEWGNIPIQILDGIAGVILGAATLLLVKRYARGTGNYNTALSIVLTMQDVGGALSITITNFIVGSEGKFSLAFMTLADISLLTLPNFYISQKSPHLKGAE